MLVRQCNLIPAACEPESTTSFSLPFFFKKDFFTLLVVWIVKRELSRVGQLVSRISLINGSRSWPCGRSSYLLKHGEALTLPLTNKSVCHNCARFS